MGENQPTQHLDRPKASALGISSKPLICQSCGSWLVEMECAVTLHPKYRAESEWRLVCGLPRICGLDW